MIEQNKERLTNLLNSFLDEKDFLNKFEIMKTNGFSFDLQEVYSYYKNSIDKTNSLLQTANNAKTEKNLILLWFSEQLVAKFSS